MPVMVGSSVHALRLARALFERSICAQALVYPTVEESGARLRFLVHATHTPDQIDTTVEALAEELSRIQPTYFDPPSTTAEEVLRREGARLESY